METGTALPFQAFKNAGASPEWLIFNAILILLAAGVLIFTTLIYRRYLNVSIRNAFLVSLLCLTFYIVLLYQSFLYKKIPDPLYYSDYCEHFWKFFLLYRGILFFFAIPLAIKLYDKWINARLTPEEKLAGIDGVRAWLTPGNLICCLGTAFCSWQGYKANYWGVLILLLGALIAYPALNIYFHKKVSHPSPKEDLSQAREKIFQLLENGKITAQESVELLKALIETGESSSSKTAANENQSHKTEE